MKNKTLLSTFLFLLFAVSTAWATIGGSGTQSDPYTINSTDDWDTFASNVGNGTTYQDKYVKLTADITVETMVGTSSNPFKGTFNGAGHTLDIIYDETEDVCAPFRFIDGATIVCLRVGGRIHNFGKQSAGIVGYSYGNSKLISSLSEVHIISLYNGNASNAGLIASVQDGTVTINNCAFFGSLQKSVSLYIPTNNGGLVGWTEPSNNAKASISNSLFDPSRLTMDGEQTLACALNPNSSLTIYNCYYTKAFGAAQGSLTSATGEELVSLLGSGWEVEYEYGTAVPIMNDYKNLTLATVSGIKNYYSYTGNTIAINYTVTALDGTTLTKGAHFTETISPATVKDKGEYTLTITGKGDYSGSWTFHFKVDDLTSATVSGIKDYYSYTGNTIDINYTVTALDGTRLTKGMHYTETISPATVKDMGDYTLTITGKGDYSGSQTFHFTVGPYIPDGLSVDNDYSYPEAGYYYVNMPSSGTTTLTFNEASITTFKIYDDGGKGGSVSSSGQPGNYSAKYSGYLIINAPTGYVIQLTGSISTSSRSDYLRIHDGATSESPKLTRDLFSVVDYAADDIGVLLSSGKSVCLYFEGGAYTRAGFDLTAKLINMNDAYNVNMASADNGSIISDKPTAKVHETVSLTATPDNGYMLCDVEVKDATGHTINISGDLWQNGVLDVTFKMPASDVTVTPVFCTSGNLYVNMPVEGTISRTIPATETSVKVYDDGGIDGNYNYRANGYLQLAAPDGYLLKLSGGMKSSSRGLTVYDGNSTNASMLKNKIYGNIDDIGTVTTTGRYMLLFFNSIDHYDGEGLDLTVTLVDARPSRDVRITEVTGGSITANPTSAKVYETVELNISPSTNYLLKDLTVTDESNNAIEFSGGEWYTNSDIVTFTMPASAVTVTPTFTDNLTATDDGLSIAMPADGVINATIPSNVQSYKVKYNHKLTASVSSTLEMTAPEGYLLQLSATGSASMNNRTDRVYFRVYDGAFEPVYGHKLIDDKLQNSYHYTYNNTGVVSTGNKMTVYCWAIANYGMDLNLDLTVKLVSASTSNAVSVSNSITNGQVVSDKNTAEPNEIVTLTATPDAGYVLESISVTDENGTASLTPAATDATFGDVSYYAANNFTFKMRLSDATVTATFMPKTDFFVNMPKTGQRDFTIPDGTTSFKVYDNSGKNGYYTLNDNGKLLLTAPEGYVMHVSGYVKLYKSSNDGDYLDIYDGNSTSATNLRHLKNGARNAYYDDEGNYFDTPTTPVYVISSTNQILLHFVTDGSGYVSSYGGVYLTITLKKSLTNSEISIAAIPDQTYTGSAICPVANVTDGETPLVLGTDYTVTCTNNISAGTAEMTVTGMGDYAGVDPITKSFKIVPKEITVIWGNQTSFVYNGTEQAPTATAEGLVNGDECTITVSGAKDVGSHTATATELSNANYKLPTTGLEQNFEITKATLTVTAKNKTIAYGDEPANDGVEYSGFVGEEGASVLGGTLAYEYNYVQGDPPGEYSITPSGLTADNYEIEFVAGKLTVERKEISVAWGNQTSFVYNGTEQAPTATAEGLVDGDECLITVSGAKDVGSHTATATKLSNANYKLPTTGLEQNFEITKATLTVTAKNKTIAYGDEPANDGVEYAGFAGEENASVLGGTLAYGYNYKKGNKTGEYTITPSGLTSDNYEINFVSGTLTVETKKTTFAAIQVFEDENGKRAEIAGEYDGPDAVNITEDIKNVAVTFNRTFKQSGFATIVLPFDYDANDLEGVKSIIEFTGMRRKANGDTTVGMSYVWCNKDVQDSLEELATAAKKKCLEENGENCEDLGKFEHCNEQDYYANAGKMVAYTPYMVQMGTANISFKSDVTLKKTITPEARVGDWVFRGTLESHVWTDDETKDGKIWAFAGKVQQSAKYVGQFVKLGGGASATALKAYMICEPKQQNPVQQVRKYVYNAYPTSSSGDRVFAPVSRLAAANPPALAGVETSSLESLDVVIVSRDQNRSEERTTIIGSKGKRTGEIRMNRNRGMFDLKGRRVNESKKAKGVYYKR